MGRINENMQKFAIKDELMLKTALLMNLEATMQNRQKWCHNLHSMEEIRFD